MLPLHPSPPRGFFVVPEADRYVSLLREVAERTGKLVGLWQALGFVHGEEERDLGHGVFVGGA